MTSLLLNSDKIDVKYSSYKYDDIKSEWIIYQGDLEYLYGENIFKTSLFKKSFIVLTYIFNENLIILYLYSNKTKFPFKYFQLNKTDELNDRCEKVIVGHPGLFFMELIQNKNDKSEIFAARSVLERNVILRYYFISKLWIQIFYQTISKLNPKNIIQSISDIQSIPTKLTWKDDSPKVSSHSPINYSPFKDYESNKSIPINFPTDIQSIESIDDYENPDFVSSTDSNKTEIFSWEKIFYNNINNDFINILNNIDQTGIFLVRPQSTKSLSNTHQYTLCVYDNAYIQKFAIHQLPINNSNLNYLFKFIFLE